MFGKLLKKTLLVFVLALSLLPAPLLVQRRFYGSNISEKGASHIYFITPTVYTTAQEIHLNRLASQLALIPKITWYIVEDGDYKNPYLGERISHVLNWTRTHFNRSANDGFSYEIMAAKPYIKSQGRTCRGLNGRMTAVEQIAKGILEKRLPHGVLFFGDDDNIYTFTIFADMRRLYNEIMVWPAGCMTSSYFNFPILSANNSVLTFFDSYQTRKYPMDMGNFAISTRLLEKQLGLEDVVSKWIPKKCLDGTLETRLLQKLGLRGWRFFVPGAYNATTVGYWHTRLAYNLLIPSVVLRLLDLLDSVNLRARFVSSHHTSIDSRRSC